ncbi:helix-turn-helix domain-containing protein [Nonomuraea sp. NPDC047529]|uniref:helix-turn-helix domain-containing protein n=1 Tax=Nonomuraea sp. NPDC047529 TaxID=3155623 RepID=UPI0033F97429
MAIIADLSPTGDRMLTSKEVGLLFRVDSKTAVRWAATGRLAAIRTPGGRLLRFPEAAVYAALQSDVTAEAVAS